MRILVPQQRPPGTGIGLRTVIDELFGRTVALRVRVPNARAEVVS